MPSAHKLAAALISLSGILHIAALFLSGYASETWILVAIGVMYQFLAAMIARGKRWIAWIGFAFMLIGAIGALSASMSDSNVPSILFQAIAAVDALAALALFVVLWRTHRPQPA